MCEGGAQQGCQTSFKIISRVINENEMNVQQRDKLLSELETFLGPGGSGVNGFPSNGLDTKSRDDFQPLFN